MTDRDGTAPQRERSRGRFETRSRRSPEAQGVDTSRIERLETQVARLSDSLISLGPALQQVIQLSSNPNFVAQNVAAPTVLPGSQMPIPPAQVPQNPAPGLAQPDPTAQPSDLGNPTNVNADPLQTSDPWRNYTILRHLERLAFLNDHSLRACQPHRIVSSRRSELLS